MKTILSLFFTVLVVSCEKQASEAEVNQAREQIAELGSRIGHSEASLQHAKEPGEVALATEDLRDEKAKLERVIVEMEKVISRDESLKIAGISQEQSREIMLKGFAENAEALAEINRESDQKAAALRREIEQNQRDMDLLRAMEKAQSELETAQSGLELALIDAGHNERLEAVQAEHKKQRAAAKVKIDAQTKKVFPNGAPFDGQFILPEN